MIFDFFINRELVAGGCVTVESDSRAWCQGWREGDLKSLAGNFTSSGSDLVQV